MALIVGVRFRNAGKIYYFDPNQLQLRVGDHVLVETSQGKEMGLVCIAPREVSEESLKAPVKKVLRMADEADIERMRDNVEREKQAYRICREKIREHELDMKLVSAEYSYDNNKLIFFFTSKDRVDFRELVKDLAGEFHTRIELRQIGVRDETKRLGGIGACGRELCCTTYLNEFAPVSIKMAKEQNLSLSPSKISGPCDRLMCCLKNEAETYEYINERLPKMGDRVITPSGVHGDVVEINVLRQLIKVMTEEDDTKEVTEYSIDELQFKPRGKNFEFTEEQKALYEALDKEGQELKKARREAAQARKDAAREKKEEEGEGKGNRNRKKADANKEGGENKQKNQQKPQKENRSENREAAEAKEEAASSNQEESGEKAHKNNHRRHRNRNRGGNRENQQNQQNPAPKE